MTEQPPQELLPVGMQRVLALVLTSSAALLYAVVMIYAIVRTLVAPEVPDFNANMVRAAGALSGLVGAVVTAGFARSQRPITVQMSTEHPMGGPVVSAWGSIKPPSRTRLKLWSLAETLGMQVRLAPSVSKSGEMIEEPVKATIATWIAIVYVVIYLLVGMAALLVSLLVDYAPDLIAQAGWVWLGTAVTTAYSFFGLDAR